MIFCYSNNNISIIDLLLLRIIRNCSQKQLYFISSTNLNIIKLENLNFILENTIIKSKDCILAKSYFNLKSKTKFDLKIVNLMETKFNVTKKLVNFEFFMILESQTVVAIQYLILFFKSIIVEKLFEIHYSSNLILQNSKILSKIGEFLKITLISKVIITKLKLIALSNEINSKFMIYCFNSNLNVTKIQFINKKPKNNFINCRIVL